MAVPHTLFLIWGFCAVGMVVFERIQARYGTSFFDPEHLRRSVTIYAMLLIFSPLALPLGVALNAHNIARWIPWFLSFGRGQDPYLRDEKGWPSDRGLFLSTLISRRQLFDRRLRGTSIGNWMMWEFWETPEAIILEVVDADRDL